MKKIYEDVLLIGCFVLMCGTLAFGVSSTVNIDTDKEIAISVASKEALSIALTKCINDIAVLEKKKVDLQARMVQQDGKQVYLRSIPPSPTKEAIGDIE